MRKRYIQDPETLELVEAESWVPTPKAAYVMPDIKDYKSMVTGEMITSRSQHREHLKRHNMIEIGNEIKAHMNTRPPEDKSLRRDLINAYQRHR